ncbi:MAG TPA: hypothetical protein VGC32_12200 [Solirubrobacterales bacterium]
MTPFIGCEGCGIVFYGGALWSGRDLCPGCGDPLRVPHPGVLAFPPPGGDPDQEEAEADG